MSSRWLNDSNLSPFFICCASLSSPGRSRPRRGGGWAAAGMLGTGNSPGGVPFAPQQCPKPPRLKPREGELKRRAAARVGWEDVGSPGAALPCWPRSAAKCPWVHGTAGLGDACPPQQGPDRPPWLCRGLPAPPGQHGGACRWESLNSKRSPRSASASKLALSVAGEGGWFGEPKGLVSHRPSTLRSLPGPQLRKSSPGRARGI